MLVEHDKPLTHSDSLPRDTLVHFEIDGNALSVWRIQIYCVVPCLSMLALSQNGCVYKALSFEPLIAFSGIRVVETFGLATFRLAGFSFCPNLDFQQSPS